MGYIKNRTVEHDLVEAAGYGRLAEVRAALEKGANIHAFNDMALQDAAGGGHLDIVKLLLAKGADVNASSMTTTALIYAAESGHTDIVALLMKHGADIHAFDDNALYWAVMHRHFGTAAFLLEHGANVHARNDLPLRAAADNYNFTDMVALLLEDGADVKAKDRHPGKVAVAYEKDLFSALDLAYGATERLLTSHAAIEKTAERLGNTPSVRRYLYAAAALAAQAEMDVASFVEQQASLLEKGYHQRFPAIKAYGLFPPPPIEEYIKGITDELGIRIYADIPNLLDTLVVYAEAVTLARIAPKPQEYDGNYEPENERLRKDAIRQTAENLFGAMMLPEIHAFSHSAHRPENTIPAPLRYLKGSEWKPLMKDFTTPVRDKKLGLLKISALTDMDALKEEGSRLRHCVGGGGYDTGCLGGLYHILSIRSADGKQSLATLCVDEKLNIVKGQFHGYEDALPSASAKAAWQALQDAVRKKTFTLSLSHDAGETEKSRQERVERGVSDLEAIVGYCFKDFAKNSALIAEHFRTSLRHVQTVRDPLKHQPREHMGWQQRQQEECQRVMGGFACLS